MKPVSTPLIAGLVAATVLAAASTAGAQALADRIERVRQQRQQAARAQQQARTGAALVQRRLDAVLPRVAFNQVPVREALQAWSRMARVPIIANWQALENAGVALDEPVSIELQAVPARVVLELLLRRVQAFERVIFETTPWYVEILTREQALQRSITRVYDVRDLLMRVPRFTDAPSFSLEDALGDGGGGGTDGGSRGGGGSLFGDDDDDDDGDEDDQDGDEGVNAGQLMRAAQLAQLIRETVEPDIWVAHGGQYASIRYFDGRLIVRAPRFVQEQIGGSMGQTLGRPTPRVTTSVQAGRTRVEGARPVRPSTRGTGVSNVQVGRGSKTSSVQEQSATSGEQESRR